MAEQDKTDEKTPSEKAQARIDRGNRQALKAEAEDPADREVKVREGDTFESLDPRDDDPRRRIRVMVVDGDHAVVENLSTRRHSRIAVERLVEPHYKRAF